MAATTGAFSKLIVPGLRKVYFNEEKKWPEEYTRYFNMETSTRAYEEEAVMMGLGRLERKGEGIALTIANGKQGGTKRYTFVELGLQFDVTEIMMEDDLYNVMTRMSKMLAQSVNQTLELEAGLFLDDVATGSVYTGVDGLPLLSNSHTLLIGGTFDNNTGAVDLSPGALRTGREVMESLVDERGLPIFKLPKLLVVSPANQWIAEEILKAKQVPYSANNEPNVTQDIMQLTYTVSHYQSDSDAWLLLAAKDQASPKWFWRRKPKFKNWDDEKTGNASFGVSMRFGLGFTDWRNAYGGQG
jgi:hypothetical protein